MRNKMATSATVNVQEDHRQQLQWMVLSCEQRGFTARWKPLVWFININDRSEMNWKHLNSLTSARKISSGVMKPTLYQNDGKRNLWRRKETVIAASVKHGGGRVMVLAWRAANGNGSLVFIHDPDAKESSRMNCKDFVMLIFSPML